MKQVEFRLKQVRKCYSNLPVPKTNPYITKNLFKKWFFWKRLQIALELVNKWCISYNSVIDFGTGTGNILPCLSLIFKHVYGVDTNAKFLEIAHKLLGCFDCSNVELIRVEPRRELEYFDDNTFDCILALDVLEHIPHFKEILYHFNRVLTENGIIIFSLPNDDSFIYKIFSSEKSKTSHVVSHSDLFKFINENYTILESKSIIFLGSYP